MKENPSFEEEIVLLRETSRSTRPVTSRLIHVRTTGNEADVWSSVQTGRTLLCSSLSQ